MFMLHCSTSPFYPLFASLDVDARMHKGRNGLVLWDDTIRVGIETRKKIRALAKQTQGRDGTDERTAWFFDPFVPDVVTLKDSKFSPPLLRTPWEEIRPRCWHASPHAGRSPPMRAGTASATPRPIGP
jgi:ornithine decarboxylase